MKLTTFTFDVAVRVGVEQSFDADTSVWVTRDILYDKDFLPVIRPGYLREYSISAHILEAQEVQVDHEVSLQIVNFTREHDLGAQIQKGFEGDYDVQATVLAYPEPLADLQVWVYHRPEVHYDTTQEILALLIDADLQQVIHGAIESSHDSQIIIAAQLLDADTRQVVCRDVSTDADLALTVTQLLLDADLRLEVQAIQTEASLRQIVTNAFETDADVQITVAEWQGDFDLRLRIGGVARQESHRIL